MRMRMDLGSAAGSGKSSLHSSQSDISAISTPLPKHTTSRFPLLSEYFTIIFSRNIAVINFANCAVVMKGDVEALRLFS